MYPDWTFLLDVVEVKAIDLLPPQYPTRCRREGLKRQQDDTLTNFVGCFFSLSYFFFLFLGAEWPCRSQCWALGLKNIPFHWSFGRTKF